MYMYAAQYHTLASLLASPDSCNNSRVSCQKGPTCHAYPWQVGPFWQDTLELW